MTTITAYTAMPLRNVPNSPAGTRAPAEATTDSRADALGQLARSLDDDGAKTGAAERLKRIKGQLEYLKRWNFPPQVVMQQAAQLINELGSAASSFAAATGASGTPAATVQASNSDTAEPQATIPMGYQDVLEGDTAAKPLSAEDRAMAEEFVSVARQLKRLLEEARRKLQSEQAGNTGTAETGLDDTIAALGRMLDTPANTFTGLSTVMPAL